MEDCSFFLNGWNFEQYNSVLLIQPNCYFRKDPSSVFTVPPPAAPPNSKYWGMSHSGPFPNIDYLLIKPSKKDKKALEDTYCNIYVDNSRLPQSKRMTDLILPMIISFYNSSMISMPFWYQYTYPGNRIDEKNRYLNLEDPRIVSVRYEDTHIPWENPTAHLYNEWINLANEMFKFINEEEFIANTIPEMKDNLRRPNHPRVLLTNEDILTIYPEFYARPGYQTLIQCIVIFLISVFAVYFSLFFLEIDLYTPIIIIDPIDVQTKVD